MEYWSGNNTFGSYVVEGGKLIGEFANTLDAAKALDKLAEKGYLKGKMVVAELEAKMESCNAPEKITTTFWESYDIGKNSGTDTRTK